MRLAYAFLAEAAEAANGRFFTYGGGLERVHSLVLPTMLPSLAVVVKLRLDPEDRIDTHMVRIRGIPPDGGQPIPDLESPFGPFQGDVPRDRPAFHMIIANYRGLPITRHGEYRFEISVDGAELGSLTFYADPLPVQPEQDPQASGD